MAEITKQNDKSLKKTAFRAFFWDFLGKVLRHGAELIVSIFICRLVDPSDFGLVAMASVFIALSTVFVDFNLSTSLINKPQPTHEQYSTVFYLNIIVALLLTGIYMWIAPLIGIYYENDSIIPIVRVLAFGPLIYACSCVQRARLMKVLDFKTLTLSNTAGSVIGGLSGLTAALCGLGVWSLIIQHYVSAVIMLFEMWRRSDWRPSLIFSLRSMRELWQFSSRLFFSELMETVFSKLDVLIIGKKFSNTPSTLGYYNKSKSYNEFIVKYVSSSLGSVFFPLFSQIQSDTERLRAIVVKSIHVVCLASFGLMGLFYLVTESLIITLYTEKWTPSIPYYRIIILAGYVHPVSSILVNVIKGRGRSDYFLRAEILKKIILLAAFGALFWGIEQYLWTLVAALFVCTLFISGYYAEKEIGYKRTTLFSCMAVYFIIALACVVPGYFIRRVFPDSYTTRLFAESIFFAISYLGVNKILKTKGWDALCEIIQHGVSVIPFSGPLVNSVRRIVRLLFR